MALNNRGAGEEVEIDIPAGKKRYRIERFTTMHGESFE
jgi:hypothetical protein